MQKDSESNDSPADKNFNQEWSEIKRPIGLSIKASHIIDAFDSEDLQVSIKPVTDKEGGSVVLTPDAIDSKSQDEPDNRDDDIKKVNSDSKKSAKDFDSENTPEP